MQNIVTVILASIIMFPRIKFLMIVHYTFCYTYILFHFKMNRNVLREKKLMLSKIFSRLINFFLLHSQLSTSFLRTTHKQTGTEYLFKYSRDIISECTKISISVLGMQLLHTPVSALNLLCSKARRQHSTNAPEILIPTVTPGVITLSRRRVFQVRWLHLASTTLNSDYTCISLHFVPC